MAATPTCPDCGAELSPDAPAGLCPRCLRGGALAASADPSAAADPIRGGTTCAPIGPEPTKTDGTVPPASRTSRRSGSVRL